MNKKLPKVFQNKIDKNIFNNANYFKGTNLKRNINLEEKINEIFNSKDYMYKTRLLITLKNGEVEKTVIAKNKENLITIDNEFIKIKDIYDIKIKKD